MTQPQKKYKLAIVISHVIQYAVPLYKKIGEHKDIELTVFFCSTQGLIPIHLDTGFGLRFSWDGLSLEGFNYKFLKNYSFLFKTDSLFGIINFGIIHELRKNKYDALIIPGYAKATYLLAILTCILTKTPFIISGEPPTPWRPKLKKVLTGFIKRLILPKILSFAAGIFYIGKKSKEFYFWYKKDIMEKLYFYPFCVDNEYYFKYYEKYRPRKEQLKKELGIPGDYPVILFLSKIIYWKRPFLLLQAYEGLNAKAALVYVGSGERLDFLKKYTEQKKLKNVYFFGFQNYTQVPKFYSIADIFVLPSLGESWGLVINEAMCFGLPIICSDQVNSCWDLVRPGENGFIFKKNDIESLRCYLQYLLEHPEERLRMGENSRRIVSGWNYDLDVRACVDCLGKLKKDS